MDDKMRTAFITGASSGFGAVYARKLAARGYHLAITARRGELLQALADEIRQAQGVQVEVLEADLTQEADLKGLELYLHSSVDLALLVNNAGYNVRGSFVKTDVQKYQAMVQVHVLAPMRLTHAALPGMLQRGEGRIINVSSVMSLVPVIGSSVYAPTKNFLNTFSKVLARELEGRGVQVQALCPGYTHTGFHSTSEYRNVDVNKRIPKWMWCNADEVVETSLRELERGGPVIVVPGRQYRVLYFFIRLGLADAMSKWMSGRFRRRR